MSDTIYHYLSGDGRTLYRNKRGYPGDSEQLRLFGDGPLEWSGFAASYVNYGYTVPQPDGPEHLPESFPSLGLTLVPESVAEGLIGGVRKLKGST